MLLGILGNRLVKQLLLTTELPVYEICSQAGYVNPSQFGRLFREHYGMTPIQYRNKFAKQGDPGLPKASV